MAPRNHGDDHRPGGPDPLTWLEALLGTGGPRIVYGASDDDANIVDAGSGDWTIAWDMVNKYTITVSPAFNAPIRNVLLTATNQLAAGDGSRQAYFVETDVGDATTTTFTVYTYDIIGDPSDGSFSFAAIEAAA